jgi:hypothetical protein
MIATINPPKTYQPEPFCRTYDLTKSDPSPITPFPHQSEAISKLSQWFKQNHDVSGGMLVLPTGGGKTFTTWRFLCNEALSKGYKVLWLAHTHHLLEQAFHSLESEIGQITGTRKKLKVRVVSGTKGHFRPAEIERDDDAVAECHVAYLNDQAAKIPPEIKRVFDEVYKVNQ